MIQLYKRFFILLIFVFLWNIRSEAQVITLGNGTFTGSNFAGPANTGTAAGSASRYAYIFPASLMSSLAHGDTIRSLSFMRNGGDSLSGTCNLKIYMRTTVNTSYGTRSVNWVSLTGATGMRKVYDNNPAADVGRSPGWVRFVLSTPYVVDTVLGRNLEILTEYTQSNTQSAAILWNYENSGTVSGYAANQTKMVRVTTTSLTDTTNLSSELHPTIRIEFPRYNKDLAVNKIYSLGKLPVPQGNPDLVRAIVQNVGKQSANFTMFLRSKGANNLIDSATYTLAPMEEKLLEMPKLYPLNTGMDTVEALIARDENNSNNSRSVLRLASNNVYSYKDPVLPIAGGIGFNGSTGDFVAKFYSDTLQAINQISVSFSGSNQKFKLGIWKADGPGGRPGTNIWTSDTLQTRPSFITPVLPAVRVDSHFYVGVRQIGTVNVAFGYQPEMPVRPGTFFYASPLGDTSWVDFAPGAPFKFAIEPRLQAEHDLAAFSVQAPKDTISLVNIQTMAPRASIINYGTYDQLSPFAVKMNIFRYGNPEYSSTRMDTLSSGLIRTLRFDSSFRPVSAGDYDVHLITRLGNDQMKDNDTLKTRFTVAAFRDVGPGTIFDPSSGYDYEQFVDTIYPTVFVQNYGLDAQGPFGVRAEIYDSAGTLVYSDAKSVTLTALNSTLASFRPFPCSIRGRYSFRAFTQLGIDVDKVNDTVRRNFRIIRSNDVRIASVLYPADKQILSPPVLSRKPEAILLNAGEAQQSDPFQNYCEIRYKGNLIYMDSISINSFTGIPQTLMFKNFLPSGKGYYSMVVYSSLPTDQYRANDTLRSTFAVGVPDDVEVLSISPDTAAVLQLDSVYETRVSLRNNGYNPQNTPFPVVFRVSLGGSIQYVAVRSFTLDSGETRTFVLDTALELDEALNYEVEVFAALGSDFVRSNDTLKTFYTGAKDHDIGVSSILFPTASDTLLVNTQNVETRVRVVNYGDSQSFGRFRTVLRILNKSTQVQLYSKSIDSSMNGLDTLDLKFPSFGVSNSAVDIELEAYTVWDRDQYNANNGARSESRFMFLYDAAAISVSSPAEGKVYYTVDTAFRPVFTAANQSLKKLDGLYGLLQVFRVDSISQAETEVYRDTLIIDGLNAGVQTQFMLSSLLTPSVLGKGTYRAYLRLSHPSDQIPANNQKMVNFAIDEKTSVEEWMVTGLHVYPLPASSLLIVEFGSSDILPPSIEILDLQGRVIQSVAVNGPQTRIDVSPLVPGVYMLRTGRKLIKIIVER